MNDTYLHYYYSCLFDIWYMISFSIIIYAVVNVLAVFLLTALVVYHNAIFLSTHFLKIFQKFFVFFEIFLRMLQSATFYWKFQFFALFETLHIISHKIKNATKKHKIFVFLTNFSKAKRNYNPHITLHHIKLAQKWWQLRLYIYNDMWSVYPSGQKTAR